MRSHRKHPAETFFPPTPAQVAEAVLREHVRELRSELEAVDPDAPVLRAQEGGLDTMSNQVGVMNEALAEAYIRESGYRYHAFSCPISMAPAFKPGPCNCHGGTMPHARVGWWRNDD